MALCDTGHGMSRSVHYPPATEHQKGRARIKDHILLRIILSRINPRSRPGRQMVRKARSILGRAPLGL